MLNTATGPAGYRAITVRVDDVAQEESVKEGHSGGHSRGKVREGVWTD